MNPPHEARVNVACRIGNDEIGEFAIDPVKTARLERKVGTKPPADFIRYRLPDRTLPDVSDIVEHVIEHAMTLRANVVPVLRIECLARFRLQTCIAQQLHAACSRPWRLRRCSIAANASKMRRICGGL